MLYLQIIHFLASLLSVGYFPFSTLADIATDIDDKYLGTSIYCSLKRVLPQSVTTL